MRPFLLSESAAWCQARLLGADVEVSALAIDSRQPMPGALFAALRGENFDAHEFVEQAASQGAKALLVSHPVESPLPQLHCADVQGALGDIAAGMASIRSTCVLGLTGSNGKTTVKTLTHAILSGAGSAYANPGNRNNEIGVPLAVLEQPEDAQFGIYEMGAGQPGDIAYLAAIAKPVIALVNNIAPAHLERMESLLGVARTKGAIYEALPDDGVAVINADDAFAPLFGQIAGLRYALRFGLEGSADVRASEVVMQRDATRFRLLTPQGAQEVNLPLPGRHNLMNALAAASMAIAAGVTLDLVVEGLARAQPVEGRQTPHRLGPGVVLLDDSYNANPDSVRAAIMTLTLGGGESWLVLGDMRELGERERELHGEIGDVAREAGITRLYTVGGLSAEASRHFGPDARAFDSQEALIAELRRDLAQAGSHPDLRCLVKGSRGSRMDRVVEALLQRGKAEGASHAA